jgi:hypothetical protein
MANVILLIVEITSVRNRISMESALHDPPQGPRGGYNDSTRSSRTSFHHQEGSKCTQLTPHPTSVRICDKSTPINDETHLQKGMRVYCRKLYQPRYARIVSIDIDINQMRKPTKRRRIWYILSAEALLGICTAHGTQSCSRRPIVFLLCFCLGILVDALMNGPTMHAPQPPLLLACVSPIPSACPTARGISQS